MYREFVLVKWTLPLEVQIYHAAFRLCAMLTQTASPVETSNHRVCLTFLDKHVLDVDLFKDVRHEPQLWIHCNQQPPSIAILCCSLQQLQVMLCSPSLSGTEDLSRCPGLLF